MARAPSSAAERKALRTCLLYQYYGKPAVRGVFPRETSLQQGLFQDSLMARPCTLQPEDAAGIAAALKVAIATRRERNISRRSCAGPKTALLLAGELYNEK